MSENQNQQDSITAQMQQPQVQQPQVQQQQVQQAQVQQAPAQSAQDSIMAQMHEQMNALMEQNARLNEQIVRMINSGAQFNAQQPQAQTQPAQQEPPTYYSQVSQMGAYMRDMDPNAHRLQDMARMDLSIEDLANEIGTGH